MGTFSIAFMNLSGETPIAEHHPGIFNERNLIKFLNNKIQWLYLGVQLARVKEYFHADVKTGKGGNKRWD